MRVAVPYLVITNDTVRISPEKKNKKLRPLLQRTDTVQGSLGQKQTRGESARKKRS